MLNILPLRNSISCFDNLSFEPLAPILDLKYFSILFFNLSFFFALKIIFFGLKLLIILYSYFRTKKVLLCYFECFKIPYLLKKI